MTSISEKSIIKIIIGVSGGVDSSVAAYLLKQQADVHNSTNNSICYHIEALFMKNWEEDDTDSYCAASADLADAQSVCDQLGITLHTANFASEYWDKVFTYFLEEYKNGRTPNPDVLCNSEIKFKAFLEHALNNLNADYIATGHYVKTRLYQQIFNPTANALSITDNNIINLEKAKDLNKDQSYFLHKLNQNQLSKSLFPLGEYTKPKIRDIAQELGLITAEKKDSTGICFIGERKFKDFLQQYLPAKPGNIIDSDNNIIGTHDGLMYYTIGQRQGLQLGGLKNYSELPWYVAGKDLVHNNLIVVQGSDHPLLFKKQVQLSDCHFIDTTFKDNKKSISITAKSRYRQHDQDAKLCINNNDISIEFEKPQRAITPGQYMVFYNNNICLGGGIIN